MSENKSRFYFHPVGFHGDKYLIKLIDTIIPDCDLFIETGTNVASTLAYVAKKYPNVQCFSCEPDVSAYNKAISNTNHLINAFIYNEPSQVFLKRFDALEAFDKKVLCWLDAHDYGHEWPLKEEISYLTAKFNHFFIFIDDFKVPGMDCFGYDVYNDQECSYEFIKNNIAVKEYFLHYPSYTKKTSKHHPLRGWGLITNTDIAFLLNTHNIDYLTNCKK